jgi:hypothetical protein
MTRPIIRDAVDYWPRYTVGAARRRWDAGRADAIITRTRCNRRPTRPS